MEKVDEVDLKALQNLDRLVRAEELDSWRIETDSDDETGDSFRGTIWERGGKRYYAYGKKMADAIEGALAKWRQGD